MRKSQFTEEQIIRLLKEAEAGRRVTDLCREHGISSATLYRWKSKYSGMEVSEAEAPAAIPTKDLAVVVGIAADKVARFEGWGREGEAALMHAAAQALEQLFSKIKVQVTVGLAEDVIDVTPLPKTPGPQ